jgi:hypothetical protein
MDCYNYVVLLLSILARISPGYKIDTPNGENVRLKAELYKILKELNNVTMQIINPLYDVVTLIRKVVSTIVMDTEAINVIKVVYRGNIQKLRDNNPNKGLIEEIVRYTASI